MFVLLWWLMIMMTFLRIYWCHHNNNFNTFNKNTTKYTTRTLQASTMHTPWPWLNCWFKTPKLWGSHFAMQRKLSSIVCLSFALAPTKSGSLHRKTLAVKQKLKVVTIVFYHKRLKLKVVMPQCESPWIWCVDNSTAGHISPSLAQTLAGPSSAGLLGICPFNACEAWHRIGPTGFGLQSREEKTANHINNDRFQCHL